MDREKSIYVLATVSLAITSVVISLKYLTQSNSTLSREKSQTESESSISLLYFYDPECQECKSLNEAIQSLIDHGYDLIKVNLQEDNNLLQAVRLEAKLGTRIEAPTLVTASGTFCGAEEVQRCVSMLTSPDN